MSIINCNYGNSADQAGAEWTVRRNLTSELSGRATTPDALLVGDGLLISIACN